MCWEKVILLSMMTPRFRQWGVGERVELSKEKFKSMMGKMRDLEPSYYDNVRIGPVKFEKVCLHPERQFERVQGGGFGRFGCHRLNSESGAHGDG